MRTARFSLRKVLVISRFNRSEMNGILRYSHSVFYDWGSRGRFWGRSLLSMASSVYPLSRSMSSNSQSCLSNVVWVEHFC